MSAREFRNNPIDRRRLAEPSRSQYNPSGRLTALGRVKAYREFNNYQSNAPKSTTVHRGGSGGFKLGRYATSRRGLDGKMEEIRTDSIFRSGGFEGGGESRALINRTSRPSVGGYRDNSGGTYFSTGNSSMNREARDSGFGNAADEWKRIPQGASRR